ncbi:WD40 repeat-like protein [Jaminaea rosea]|uniref:WD40 repeat-like protein n=1 Tax=Jaminaea rosea TaxID=1569628 RepID=A0A316UXD4_9BASI|nr:WD40 repeat-like protein [Jaminaea rosea]PWN29872.1 WD40 repeat-like protein [Jaminaea rosea]
MDDEDGDADADEGEEDDEADEDDEEDDDDDDDDDEDEDDDDDDDDASDTSEGSDPSEGGMDIDTPAPRSNSPTSYLRKTQARLAASHPSHTSLHAKSYAIEPLAALPHSAHVHAMALSGDGSVLLTGGSDGHVRRYDVYGTMNGRNMLTLGVRHAYVEGITRGGVLHSWWGNEERNADDDDEEHRPVSAVHSLAIQRDALWSLSGTASGAINLTTLRHEPGVTQHVLRKHRGPVSALALGGEAESELVSGGWDGGLHQWDLNTGQVVRSYAGCAGQVSGVAFRPAWDYSTFSQDVFMATTLSGQVMLYDRRVPTPGEPSPSRGVLALPLPARTPPWCSAAIWAPDGDRIYVARRNETVEEWDARLLRGGDEVDRSLPWSGQRRSSPLHTRTLRLPTSSGPVTALRFMPNGRHLVCASTDNVRLWDLDKTPGESSGGGGGGGAGGIPFRIVAGHHGGAISSLLVDPTGRFLLSASGDRGWEGGSTECVLVGEISAHA